MSKQNGGEGGIIINMSSLAGKGTIELVVKVFNNNVSHTSKSLPSSLKFNICLILFMVLWNFTLRNNKILNHVLICLSFSKVVVTLVSMY